MKTIDERELQKTKEKQTKTERTKGTRSYSESKSIILKQRDLYESKHVAAVCRCLKI